MLKRCRAKAEVFDRPTCPLSYDKGLFELRFRIPAGTPESTVPVLLSLTAGGRTVDQKHAGIEVRPLSTG